MTDTFNAAGLPFNGNPVVPEMSDGSKQIQFKCRKGISCWNACCSNIDISLTPYDILRLKQRLGISSRELLQKYTVPYELEPGSISGVKLRPVENGIACQFMKPEGCGVYEDRPTSCRYYPITQLSMRKQDEHTDTSSYALVREDYCKGHFEPRNLTIDEYRKEQGVEEYDDLSRGWRQLILKKKSFGPSISKPTKRSLLLFFMVCYDTDRFREFVASVGFTGLYDIPADEMKKLLIDDKELMLFGFRFLKQVLFGEHTIKIHVETAAKRMEQGRIKLRQLEEEARAKRTAEANSMYEDDDE